MSDAQDFADCANCAAFRYELGDEIAAHGHDLDSLAREQERSKALAEALRLITEVTSSQGWRKSVEIARAALKAK